MLNFLQFCHRSTFDGLTKLFSDLYLAKFSDSAKPRV